MFKESRVSPRETSEGYDLIGSSRELRNIRERAGIYSTRPDLSTELFLNTGMPAVDDIGLKRGCHKCDAHPHLRLYGGQHFYPLRYRANCNTAATLINDDGHTTDVRQRPSCTVDGTCERVLGNRDYRKYTNRLS